MLPKISVSMLGLCAAFACFGTACSGRMNDGGDGGVGGGAGGGDNTGGGGGGGGFVGDGGFARSAKASVRFKGPERLGADLAASLGLAPSAVCNEFGQYSCTAVVHVVALGGVDPYGHSVYEPATVTGSTTPLVVDRVVLSACIARVKADLETPASALVFKNVALGADGQIQNPDGAEVRAAVTELAQRAWLRDPSEAEVAAFVQLARDVEATGTAEPGKAFMQAACLAAFSSAEALFY